MKMNHGGLLLPEWQYEELHSLIPQETTRTGKKLLKYTHTHTHTHTQNNYLNCPKGTEQIILREYSK